MKEVSYPVLVLLSREKLCLEWQAKQETIKNEEIDYIQLLGWLRAQETGQ